MAAEIPTAIGEHLKRRRLELRLMQCQVASRFRVHTAYIQNWERGVSVPDVWQIPAIIEFLGYDSEPEPSDPGPRIAFIRRRLGWTQKLLAKELNVGAFQIYKWESGRAPAPPKVIRRLEKLWGTMKGRAVIAAEQVKAS